MQLQGRLTRRVAQLTPKQAQWLDDQAAALGISWAEFLRRLIDGVRLTPPPPVPDEARAIFAGELAPLTGGLAEAWQNLCVVGRNRGLTETQVIDTFCEVTGKQRGASVTMADCLTVYGQIKKLPIASNA